MPSPRSLKHLPLILVSAAAIASCAQRFDLHRGHFRDNWVGASHDRNAHYRYGLQMAADLKNADFVRFAVDFDAGSWVWPPLNGLLVGTVALAVGPDPVLAAIPSLLGWFLSIVFAYLLAARASSRFGIGAGFLSAALVIVSPAHRAYATDIMMESLGAGLTLMALHAFVVWSQVRTPRSGAWLGLAFTLLFFQKYNYWLLAASAVLVAHAVDRRGEYLVLARRLRKEIPWRSWLLAQPWRPLNYPIALSLGIALAFAVTGEFTLAPFGASIAITSNQIFVAVAFALVLLRFTIWWWSGGRHRARAWLPPEVYPVLYWHVFPVVTWFAIPFRLRTFLWFVSPANSEKEYHATFLEGVRFYLAGVEGEYVPVPEVYPILALGVLASVALIAVPRTYRAGGWVVPLFAVLALLLTFKHPNHKLRFLHTGMAGAFVAGAMGLAVLCAKALRAGLRKHPESAPSRNRSAILGIRIGCCTILVLAIVGLVVYAGNDFGGSGHASEAGLDGRGTSLRIVTDAVAPLIPENEPVADFSNVPSKFWATWMYLERSPRHALLRVDCREVGVLSSPTAEQFAEWCAATPCRCAIFVNIAPGSPLYEPAPLDETTATILGWLPASPFKLVQTVEVIEGGTITVWRR